LISPLRLHRLPIASNDFFKILRSFPAAAQNGRHVLLDSSGRKALNPALFRSQWHRAPLSPEEREEINSFETLYFFLSPFRCGIPEKW